MRIEIITRMERNEAISAIRTALSQSGGWIVDHTLFSNVSATIQFEIPAPASAQLIERLIEAQLPPVGQIELKPSGKGDLRGTLLITFIHDESDLKRPVPAFG